MDQFGKRSPSGPDKRDASESTGVRFGRAVNVLLVLCLLLPLVTAVSIFGSVNLHLWRGLPTFDPLLAKIESAQKRSGVVSGDDPRLLKELYQRLERMAALSAEAKRADSVHVVLLSLTPADKQIEPKPRTETVSALDSLNSAAVRRASLDLSMIGTSAVVVIADQPIVWQVAGAQRDQQAKVAFEGPFAFDLIGAHPGLLAGFRIAAFGGGPTASPRDYLEAGADRSYRRRACTSVKRWQSYFDVPAGSLRIWAIDNAHTIKADRDDVTADGRGGPDIYSAAAICSR
jgi:hypothetical protein